MTSEYTGDDAITFNAAVSAGLGLLIMAVLAATVEFGVFQKMIVAGDPKATFDHLTASAPVFRLASGGFLLVAMLDVWVAWALYVFIKPANEHLAKLAAWFRLVYAGAFALSITNLFSASQTNGCTPL
jgi:hypothetical protein